MKYLRNLAVTSPYIIFIHHLTLSYNELSTYQDSFVMTKDYTRVLKGFRGLHYPQFLNTQINLQSLISLMFIVACPLVIRPV